jgi:hypothetical protein
MAATVAHIEGEPSRPLRQYAIGLYRSARLQFAPHRNAPPPGDLPALRRWVSAAPRPTGIDLSCGAGGLSGQRQSGFVILVGADIDAASAETHTASVGRLRSVGDLSHTDGFLGQPQDRGMRAVDPVADGTACQPSSRLGRPKMRRGVLPTRALRERV